MNMFSSIGIHKTFLTLFLLLFIGLSAAFQPKITSISDNFGNNWEFSPEEDETNAAVYPENTLNASEEPKVELCVDSVKKAEGDNIEFKFDAPSRSTNWIEDSCKEWQMIEEDYESAWVFGITARNQDSVTPEGPESDFEIVLSYSNIILEERNSDENIVTETYNSTPGNETDERLKAEKPQEIETFKNLTYFPKPFLGEENRLKPLLVVGQDAKQPDIVSGVDISGALMNEHTDIKSSIDVDVRNKSNRNMILIGGPVVNDLTAELAAEGKATARKNYTEGQGFIEFIENPFGKNQSAVIVAGETAADTSAAADFLVNYERHQSTLKNAEKLVIDTGSKELIEKHP